VTMREDFIPYLKEGVFPSPSSLPNGR